MIIFVHQKYDIVQQCVVVTFKCGHTTHTIVYLMQSLQSEQHFAAVQFHNQF